LCTLQEIATALSARLSKLFLRDADGRRPAFGNDERLQNDPHFRDYLLFHEYFHGEDGRGMGASHQTGWTGLLVRLLPQQAAKQAPETNEVAFIPAPIDAGVTQAEG
jgi:hypothetical protein